MTLGRQLLAAAKPSLCRGLPENLARHIVIDQACMAAVLGSRWYPDSGALGAL